MFCHLITYNFVTFPVLPDSHIADHCFYSVFTVQTGHHQHGMNIGHRITCLRSYHRISSCQFLNLCSSHTKGINNVIILIPVLPL